MSSVPGMNCPSTGSRWHAVHAVSYPLSKALCTSVYIRCDRAYFLSQNSASRTYPPAASHTTTRLPSPHNLTDPCPCSPIRTWCSVHDLSVLDLAPRTWPATTTHFKLAQRFPRLVTMRLWNCKLQGEQLDLSCLAALSRLASLRVWRVTRSVNTEGGWRCRQARERAVCQCVTHTC